LKKGKKRKGLADPLGYGMGERYQRKEKNPENLADVGGGVRVISRR